MGYELILYYTYIWHGLNLSLELLFHIMEYELSQIMIQTSAALEK